MLPGKDIFLLFIGSFLLHCTNASNTKHMYALCPPDFFGIGTECYYISQKKENWLDAHFDCKDRKSRLAEPNRYEDRMIRKFLVNNDLSKESKWIGGNFNWAQRKWQWQDGKEFTYQSFSQTPGGVQELQYHCAILNPNLKYRWSASSCVEKHQYICQHRMPYVNEKHRSRIYSRWNQTYPNEQATEVEVVINQAELLKRGHRQSTPVNGRSTNTQRLSRHRNYLANEWLKKYKTQQIVLNRNTMTNEVTPIETLRRKVPQRPNRVLARRRNPSIGRDDFIQFERNKNVYRPLLTNKIEDFDRQESITVAPTISDRFYEQTRTTQRNQDDVPSPRPRNKVSKVRDELDPKEKKRLEDTKRLLETGRFEHSYTRQRIATTTTTTTTTTEPTDTEQIESERDRDLDYRRQQEEEEQERLRDEEIRRNEQRRRAEERRREEENRRRMEEERQAEERRMEEERLQDQINEEKLRMEREEELRRERLQQEEHRRAEERKRIHDEHLREREEKMRLRELELKERESEERKLREDEDRRQEENRKRLEEIERLQREEEERKFQEAENKRIDEENKRRKMEELKQKMRQNRVDISNEDQVLDDIRLKEKLRREKNAKMRERLSRLSPEEQLKFFELRRRNKKNSERNENETSTNHR